MAKNSNNTVPAPVSPEDMKKAHKAQARVGFFKLSSGESNIRLLGPSTKLRQNVYKLGGNWTNSLDGDYVINTPEILEAALELNRLTDDDVKAYSVMGDPFAQLGNRHRQLGMEVPRGVWPQTKYVWAIVDRSTTENEVLRFDSSASFKKAVDALLNGQYPDLFDPKKGFDLTVEGNGKDGIQRRYKDPIPARGEGTPVGFDFEIPNFVPQLASSALPFTARVAHLFQVYGDECMSVGFTPASFGVKQSEVLG